MNQRPVVLAAIVFLAGRAAAAPDACEQIRAACERAGFSRGTARSGTGLFVDCVAPIVQGRPQPRAARMPLPSIDPRIVAACRAGVASAAPSAAPVVAATTRYTVSATERTQVVVRTEPRARCALSEPGAIDDPSHRLRLRANREGDVRFVVSSVDKRESERLTHLLIRCQSENKTTDHPL